MRQVRHKVYGANSAGGAEDIGPVLAEARALLAAGKDLHQQGLKVEQEIVAYVRMRTEMEAGLARLGRMLGAIEKAVA